MKDSAELINFCELNLDEAKMVLSWRNHKDVKSWMHNSNDISLESHLAFIEVLKTSKDKLYFLVKNASGYIGVIDFTDIDDRSAEFGLYSNIALKGQGKILLEAICNYAFNVLGVKILNAEVFLNNKRAISLYESFNFSYMDKKTVNNMEVIRMELKNEDR